jgi:hypothetical protein
MAFKQGEVYKCPDPNCGVRGHGNERRITDLSGNAGATLLLRQRHDEEIIIKFTGE